eukprot:CAMPEP_0201867148 /NCGR_PEP_ID=MMETSP0902-20130614/1495_1 /ASSEMBLY_ACC=CAM_ASM_000551 /TAXON_ID=420261 /ORGANISM="Thalassiosira antarctica, Strain CCMP982" /LENGTH=347 /DNA_ID=CAMNT_0048392267 /DNA_START=381 /DNA_END=1424 /DNA_ORIENTATION=-
MTTTTRHLSSQNTKLAHEWIVDGNVVPQSKMEGDGIMNDDGKEVIVFLHGLLGNAKNLRTPAKKLTQQLPHLNALLLDIRGHGNSSSSPKTTPPSSSSSFAQPHNFQSCVQDIFDTLSPLGLTGPNSPTAICGHSLGGRIALQYSHFLCTAQKVSGENERMVIEPPKQTWVLDSVPGQADPSVHSVLRAISSLSTPFPSKSWLVDTLVKEHKMNKGVAMWIATNLRDGGGDKKSFEWIFDLGIANELVENFSDQNFTEMIHDVTKSKADGGTNDNDKNSMVQLVMAGKNKFWSKEIVSELQSIPSFQKTTSPSPLFQMHTLDKAGHWVHVDDLEGLLKLMVEGLQER